MGLVLGASLAVMIWKVVAVAVAAAGREGVGWHCSSAIPRDRLRRGHWRFVGRRRGRESHWHSQHM